VDFVKEGDGENVCKEFNGGVYDRYVENNPKWEGGKNPACYNPLKDSEDNRDGSVWLREVRK
jgi:hypothetical protein